MSTTDAAPQSLYNRSVNADELEWSPIGPEGNYIKPISVGPEGEWTILLRIDKGVVESRHRHRGSLMTYVLTGTVEIYGMELRPGSVYWEHDGALHEGVTATADHTALITGRWGSVEFLDDNDQVTDTLEFYPTIKSLAEQVWK